MSRRPASTRDEEASPTGVDPKPTTARARKERSRSEKINAGSHALAPDLDVIRRFIMDMVARGGIAELIRVQIQYFHTLISRLQSTSARSVQLFRRFA
jgi:hypothetical protein